MSEFYTYMWLRADAMPYYIGKGKDNRAFSGQHSVPPPCRARILIQFWSSEQEAFDMEKFYIRLFGRKDNGTGILCNQTDGGEGCGLPEHYLAEHSRRMMGAGNPQFGKPSPGQPLATAAARFAPENTRKKHRRMPNMPLMLVGKTLLQKSTERAPPPCKPPRRPSLFPNAERKQQKPRPLDWVLYQKTRLLHYTRLARQHPTLPNNCALV